MHYYKIDGMLIAAENENTACKRYKAYFHKRPVIIKIVK